MGATVSSMPVEPEPQLAGRTVLIEVYDPSRPSCGLDFEIWRTKGHLVTGEDIVYDRRGRLFEYAAKIGNLAQPCRVFGGSRNTCYEWINKARSAAPGLCCPRNGASLTSPT